MIFYPFHYNASFHAWDILPCLLQFFSLSAQIFLKININFSEFIWQIKYTQHSDCCWNYFLSTSLWYLFPCLRYPTLHVSAPFPPSQKMLQDKYYLQWIHQVTKYTQHSGRPAMLLHFMSHIENINEFQMLENFVQVQLKWHILFRNYNWIHLFTVTY